MNRLWQRNITTFFWFSNYMCIDTASYQSRYKNGTSSSLVWQTTLKRELLAPSEELP